ncbi:MAG: alpha-hydroxy-acid oxidizing protein [Chloroflexi bacterium]|nr:alpha-hydroxy-acid oxidizing protein [Chloroflexota bacterium]
MTDPGQLTNVADYESLARTRMDPAAWDYQAGGSGDERSLADNLAAWARIRLRPRVLVDVTSRTTATAAFGTDLPHPIVVAPTAAHRLSHSEAELATARGAAAAGALYTVSTIASVPIEEVAGAAPDGPRWFQLYAPDDRGECRELVERAVAAGYGAVVLTVDLPLAGNRERDVRNRFVLDLGANLAPDQPTDETGLVMGPTLDWDDLAWLRSVCPIPLLAKGILRADDALRAVEAGCDGIWVSNHGGRQLDTAISGADALPEIAAAVADRALLIVDGGVRRGIDVLKGLALGAHLVAIGRPVLWGLAVDGAAGVQRVIEILRDELSLAMALTGCRTLAEITPDLVAETAA